MYSAKIDAFYQAETDRRTTENSHLASRGHDHHHSGRRRPGYRYHDASCSYYNYDHTGCSSSHDDDDDARCPRHFDFLVDGAHNHNRRRVVSFLVR